MDGDLGALPALCDVADEFGCLMMVDDAHASGVFGQQGRGTVDHFGVHGRVHVQVGTLSKAIGALGGYVAGSRSLIEFLHHKARPFLFSTSHPPSVTATCLAALDVLESDSGLIERLWDNTRFFKAGLAALGLDTGRSESPITPVIVGDAALAMKLSDRLFELGVFAQGIGFPTVPQGKARVRTIVTATHTREELSLRARRVRDGGRGARSGSRVMSVPPLPRSEKGRFFKAYTQGLSTTDLGRLFTRDAPDAYRFFSRGIDFDELQKLPWHTPPGAHHAHAVPGVHAAAHAGAAPDLRHLARGHAHRPDGAVPRDALPARAASGLRARARCGCSSASCCSTCWCCSRSPTGCRSRTTSRSPARSSRRCCRAARSRRRASKRSA